METVATPTTLSEQQEPTQLPPALWPTPIPPLFEPRNVPWPSPIPVEELLAERATPFQPAVAAETDVAIEMEVTAPLGVPVAFSFGEIRTETHCEYDAAGTLIAAVTTIIISPDPYWENWEGAPLTYSWTASNGGISGSGLTANWSRSVQSGRLGGGNATLTVSDGTDGSFTPAQAAFELTTCQ